MMSRIGLFRLSVRAVAPRVNDCAIQGAKRREMGAGLAHDAILRLWSVTRLV